MRRSLQSLMLALCVSICPAVSRAASADGIEIVRVEGAAAIHGSDGRVNRAVRPGTRVPPGGRVSTGEGARVVVRLGNSGFAVLDRKSELEVSRNGDDGVGLLRHVTGWIYYALSRATHRDKPVRIQTAVAALGIRGTRFLVVMVPDRNEVGMRKGTLDVESLKGEFELRRTGEQDEFEAYREQGRAAVQKEREEFQEYQAATEKAFAEYTRSFALDANRQAVFDGRKVREQALGADILRDMEAAEAFGAEWLEQVRD